MLQQLIRILRSSRYKLWQKLKIMINFRENMQPLQKLRPQIVFRQHSIHRLPHHPFPILCHYLSDISFLQIPRLPGVFPVNLFSPLSSIDHWYFSIDYHYEVSTVLWLQFGVCEVRSVFCLEYH